MGIEYPGLFGFQGGNPNRVAAVEIIGIGDKFFQLRMRFYDLNLSDIISLSLFCHSAGGKIIAHRYLF
ncbi:MAG: hypothetical protein QG657_2221 [Acidobacteriota bacterium]|nr:hypothetical protein [Acidobacteriota bacterium]